MSIATRRPKEWREVAGPFVLPNLERGTGLEPATRGSGTHFTLSPPGVSGSQGLVTTGGGYDAGVQPSQP